MTHPTIILEPRLMFETLQNLEQKTQAIVADLGSLGGILQELATMTYAVHFGALIKKAEFDINHAGHAVIGGNNAFNESCKEVVNQLVNKFASEGVKSDYSSPPFENLHLKVNPADRAAIYFDGMSELLDVFSKEISIYNLARFEIQEIYHNTKKFWVGDSADRIRRIFVSKVVPIFEDLTSVLVKIHSHGTAFIEDAARWDKAHGVQ